MTYPLAGTGELTKRIHAIVSSGINAATGRRGSVCGVDAAHTMIDGAKEKSAAPGLEYDVCDGHDLERWLKDRNLTGKFDKVFR
jgi:ubiquinone/menaquinone biosynthesis C-methylase UbiE